MAESATEAVLGLNGLLVDQPSEEKADPREGPGCEQFTSSQHQPSTYQGQPGNESHPGDYEPVQDAAGVILRHQDRFGFIPPHSTRTPNS
jgi:hypothetical protein